MEVLDFENPTFFIENLFNMDAHFRAPFDNQLMIGNQSAGIGKAYIQGSQLVPLDILGVSRVSPADIGAYQHLDF